MVQCPRCKKIEHNGKFIKTHNDNIIFGISHKLCPDCRYYMNRIQILY